MKYISLVGVILFSNLVTAQTEWMEVPLEEGIFFETATPYKQGEYDITVPAYSALEFQIAMKEGDVISYTWNANIADPALLDIEFHGHTEPVDGKGTLIFYKVHNEGKGNGSMKAPFEGSHGWYLNNTGETDVMVKFSVSGFYEDL